MPFGSNGPTSFPGEFGAHLKIASIVLVVKILRDDAVKIARSVQDPKHLDSASDCSIEVEVIAEAGNWKEAHICVKWVVSNGTQPESGISTH